MKQLLFFLVGACLFLSCRKSENVFDDPAAIEILEAQDHRNSKALLPFLSNPDSTYRRLASLAFASVKDSTAALPLLKLLQEDSISTVKEAAAFALGFCLTPTLSDQLFETLTELPEDVLPVALEAYGRIGSRSLTPWFGSSNSKIREGAVWGHYRMALRIPTDSLFLPTFNMLGDSAEKVRLAAAHFLVRGKMAQNPDSVFGQRCLSYLENEPSADVRMAIAGAFRKFKTKAIVSRFKELTQKETNPEVLVNSLRAIAVGADTSTLPFFTSYLNHTNAQVSYTASIALNGLISPSSKSNLLKIARSLTSTRNRAAVYQAILKTGPDEVLVSQIKSEWQQLESPYDKSFLIEALGESVLSQPFLEEIVLTNPTPIIRSTAINEVVEWMSKQSYTDRERPERIMFLTKAFNTKDPAVMAAVASFLTDTTNGFLKTITDVEFLKAGRATLKLPRDFEAVEPIEKALAIAEGRVVTPVQKEWNHPINWTEIRNLSSDPIAIVETTKGTVKLRMLVNQAPGSVLNFIELSNAGYFDGKYFHRVVPNFVIQTGCNRGDGMGSEDYSIRSEIGEHKYKTGSVGMASAGPDTEGTQWFITHSPTPHLDGSYTLFAEVIEGQEVVAAIEVGDQIKRIKMK